MFDFEFSEFVFEFEFARFVFCFEFLNLIKISILKKKTFDYQKLIFGNQSFFCWWFLAIVAF